jgi:(p)ppGpp synthase/HD superfamily hydrolase
MIYKKPGNSIALVRRRKVNHKNDIKIPLLTQRFEQAFAYAFQLHAHQLRKGGSVPYISHLMGVAALVLEDGGDEDEAIAALLHDAVEDQGSAAIRDEIQQRFGDRVLNLVDACTESEQLPKPPWKQRKLQALAQMRQAEPAALRVMLADKLHNLRSIWADRQRQGDGVWDRFNASRNEVLWFYGACVEAVGDRFDSPMVTELQLILSYLNE